MKQVALSALLICLFAPAALAERVEFRGIFCLTAANAACVAEGWGVGACMNMRYAPSNVADNGNSSRFSIIDKFFAENYTLQNGTLVGATFKSVVGTSIGKSVATFAASMRISNQAPPTLTAATPFVNLTGAIRDFDGVSNCLIGFRATGLPNVTP